MAKRDVIQLLKEFEVPLYDSGSTEFVRIQCPYHNDKHDRIEDCNGNVSKTTGRFNCFSCSAIRDVINVIATIHKQPERIIEAFSANLFGDNTHKVDNSSVELWHQELMANQKYLNKLLDIHGITLESVQKYRMGWTQATGRVVLPIKNKLGDYINLRMYLYPNDKGEKPKMKMLSQKNAKASVWPLDVLEEQTIIITEGEYKAILLNQLGFPAMSGTAGAGTWKPEWCDFFHGKDVVVILDSDEKGRAGAAKLCYMLHPLTRSLKNVYMTEVVQAGWKDVTDYFVKLNKKPEDMRKLIDETSLFVPPKFEAMADVVENDPIYTKLSLSSQAQLFNKVIDTHAVVSAKGTSPYIVPKKVKVNCPKGSKDYCAYCPVARMEKDYAFDISPSNPILLELIDKAPKVQDDVLKRVSRIYQGCKVYSFERVDNHNIEEVRLIPQIAIGHASEEQVTRKAYYVGHGIGDNASYAMTARACVEPQTARATLIVYKAEKAENDIDSFELSMDLSIFKPLEWTKEALIAKLNDIHEDLEANVTRIYQRRDLHLFYDIAWHSVLYLSFKGRENIKGWADVLVIGDSGQGKSECSSALIKHYQCGERVDTKRASVAGIVGGLQETNGRWFVTWGTIPLNDRRLVILEEIKGMPTEQFTRMTDMRSSGMAEIVKIERARTHARTRLIMISNPRSETDKISAYNYGVDAVRELIGSLEDIRRFDMVMAVASGEVSNEVVNAAAHPAVPHKYTTDLSAHLVGWAWSRKQEDIIVECEDEILKVATRMAEKYSSACPIVEPSDQRLKVLRLAAGLAARTYSTDDGKTLRVRKCHVEVVEEFLDRIYGSKALGYKEYSEAKKHEESIQPVDFSAVPNARDTVRGFIDTEYLSADIVGNFTNWTVESCHEFIGKLTRANCIRPARRGTYRKTSGFIEMLKQLDREGKLSNKSFNEIITDKGQF